MNQFDIANVLNISELTSELDLERASALEARLRWMSKKDPSLKPLRRHLGELIKAYEQAFWANEQFITESQIAESDQASAIVSYETGLLMSKKACR